MRLRQIAKITLCTLPALLGVGATASTANATLVFDGKSPKVKPATITGFHGYAGKGEITSAKLLIGGPDAEPGDYGQISWTRWNKNKAVGFGTGWHLGRLSYSNEVGANPWNGGKVRVTLRLRKNGQFKRLAIMQRTSWRSEQEQGRCDYFLSFAYKPSRHRSHPWMQFGIGGGWPLTKQPCFGINVS